MNIAVIGWGSLIWSPRHLALRSRWRADGPCLPVEFARRSSAGRVTLVVMPGRRLVRTYWAMSRFDDLHDAIDDLRVREGTTSRWIQSLPSGTGEECQVIADWLDEQRDVDAAVWTGLEPSFSVEGLEELVVAYLTALPEQLRTRAREYVELAPPQTITPVRAAIEDALGWRRRPLPPELFDGSAIGPPCEVPTDPRR